MIYKRTTPVALPNEARCRQRNIGLRMRAFREALDLSVKRFAELTGIPAPAVLEYESGARPLTWGQFKAVQAAPLAYPPRATWIATGRHDIQKLGSVLSDHEFSGFVEDQSLFSWVADTFLIRIERRLQEEATAELDTLMHRMRATAPRLAALADVPNVEDEEEVQAAREEIRAVEDRIQAVAAFDARFEELLAFDTEVEAALRAIAKEIGTTQAKERCLTTP